MGIWELDRISLRTMASGSGRPARGPHPRDISCQTRTRNAAGAGCHSAYPVPPSSAHCHGALAREAARNGTIAADARPCDPWAARFYKPEDFQHRREPGGAHGSCFRPFHKEHRRRFEPRKYARSVQSIERELQEAQTSTAQQVVSLERMLYTRAGGREDCNRLMARPQPP